MRRSHWRGLSGSGKPLWARSLTADEMLTNNASHFAALSVTSLGPLSFPAWQLQRNRMATAQRQLWVSFSHPPPRLRRVRPALLPRVPGFSWYNNWTPFRTLFQSCLTSQETVRTRRLSSPPPHCHWKEVLTCRQGVWRENLVGLWTLLMTGGSMRKFFFWWKEIFPWNFYPLDPVLFLGTLQNDSNQSPAFSIGPMLSIHGGFASVRHG